MLIFANGSADDGIFVQRAISQFDDPLIIAADGGARMAIDVFGLMPDIVIGDMDSLDEAMLDELVRQNVVLKRYSPEKDETDLELALLWAAEQGATQICVIGAMGRRIDQTFGNVYLLSLPSLNDIDVRLVSGDQQLWLAKPGTHYIAGQPGDTVSLIPLSSDVNNIRTEQLYYPLKGETLYFGPARGMSNVLESETGVVTFDAGLLLIVHTSGRAE